MNKKRFALLGLMGIVSVFSFVGCSSPNGTEADAKKASDSQKSTSGAPSLANPKPANDNSGK